jgi:hypothetical protein
MKPKAGRIVALVWPWFKRIAVGLILLTGGRALGAEINANRFLEKHCIRCHDGSVQEARKHRHRYHGVFAPNHKLRRAVTALAIGNIGKRGDAAAGGHGGGGHATEGCCDTHAKPRSHDTSRIAWAKLI